MKRFRFGWQITCWEATEVVLSWQFRHTTIAILTLLRDIVCRFDLSSLPLLPPRIQNCLIQVRHIARGYPEMYVRADRGICVHSSNPDTGLSLDGCESAVAIDKMIAWLKERNLGEKRVNFKLRDWLFARQRYWGEPFPLIYPQGSDVGSDANCQHDMDGSCIRFLWVYLKKSCPWFCPTSMTSGQVALQIRRWPIGETGSRPSIPERSDLPCAKRPRCRSGLDRVGIIYDSSIRPITKPLWIRSSRSTGCRSICM